VAPVSEQTKILVFRDPEDGLWSVVRGPSFEAAFDELGEWIAEGVATWERAMRIANESV